SILCLGMAGDEPGHVRHAGGGAFEPVAGTGRRGRDGGDGAGDGNGAVPASPGGAGSCPPMLWVQ
ncbi:MAG: hypothetical protein ACK6D3_20410, partial [Planctomycetaceae bacterium]